MNMYQYLTCVMAAGSHTGFFITLGVIICLIVVAYIYSRFSASGGGEYIEVPSEDEDESYLPEDARYRADWLTVLMNYLILGYGKMSDEPKISAFKPEDGVSVLRITEAKVQFNVTVYWFKRKMVLTGFIMPATGYSNLQTVNYAFRWKGYEVPYTQVDKFIDKFIKAEENFLFDTIRENVSQTDANKILIQKLIQLALEEGFVLPEDNPMDLTVAAIYGLLELMPKIKKGVTSNTYLAFLSILITYFAKNYGVNWLQKFSLEQEVIDDLLKRINGVEPNDDEAAQTAKEEEEKED